MLSQAELVRNYRQQAAEEIKQARARLVKGDYSCSEAVYVKHLLRAVSCLYSMFLASPGPMSRRAA